MPGIAGLLCNPIGPDVRGNVDFMVSSMLQDSDCVSGIYISGECGAGLGWVCHRGSFSDCLPIWNESKDVCLIFSGENFADESEWAPLRREGWTCHTGNAGYLVRLYEEFGIKFVERLNGWFRGVLLDMRENRVALFNDRFGLGRIYWHESDGRFWFASEAKSLLRSLPETRRLDQAALGEYLACGCVLENRSLFQGISLLPPASLWTFRVGRSMEKRNYFRKECWEGQETLAEQDYHQEFMRTFSRILPRYLRASEKMGASVTGGVDSRMVMAWADAEPGRLPCYTFGGMYRDSQDVRLGRQVAAACNQPHTTISVDRTFLAQFPALARKTVLISDGAMDVSGAVELFANQRAREIAPVRLTGNYGGEILRGLVAFRPRPVSNSLYSPEVVRSANQAKQTYHALARDNWLSFIAFKQVPWHHYARLSVEQSQVGMRSPFLDNELVALAYRSPATGRTKEFGLRMAAEGNPRLGGMMTDRGAPGNGTAIWAPMSKLYQEVTFKAEYAYDYGMPRWLSKIDKALRLLRPERLLLGRHKFCHFRIWYRDELAGYLKEILLDQRTQSRSFFQSRALKQLVASHTNGSENWTLEIHQALSLELIVRELIDQC